MMNLKKKYNRTYQQGHKIYKSCDIFITCFTREFSSLFQYKMDSSTLIAHRAMLRDRDPAKYEELLRKLEPLQRKLEDLDKEAAVLAEDRLKITRSVRAGSDMVTGRNPSRGDMEVLHELSEHYASFFDGEDSPTEERSMSTLNEIMKLRRYIKHEEKVNSKRISAVLAKGEALKNEWQQKMEASLVASSAEETGSISGPSVKETESTARSFSLEKGESSKRKSDYISDSDDSSVSSSSKKIRPASTDIKDDLPELPYNPMDWDDF